MKVEIRFFRDHKIFLHRNDFFKYLFTMQFHIIILPDVSKKNYKTFLLKNSFASFHHLVELKYNHFGRSVKRPCVS